MRRVRIRSDVELARQRVAFENNRVTDTFRSLAVGQLSMQPDSLFLCELLLLQLELGRQIEQPEFLLFLRDHFIEKREVIAEKENARRVVDLRILAHVVLEEN